jgi:hypothetical protein
MVLFKDSAHALGYCRLMDFVALRIPVALFGNFGFF